MWPLLLLCFTCFQPVVLQENRLILHGGKGPCEGYIQVYHEGKWGLVGDKDWGDKTEEVVCKSIGCGRRIKSEDWWMPGSFIWLNELNCKGDEENLWNCGHPGWGISRAPNQVVKKITCSNRIEIALDGFTCSGSVKYSTDGTTPSDYFCGDKWGDNEKSVVCKALGCGQPVEDVQYPVEVEGKMKVAECVSDMTSLWQCVKEEANCKKRASVTCEAHDLMRLKGDSSNVCSGQLEIKKKNTWTQNMKNARSNDSHAWCKNMFCGDTGVSEQVGNITNLNCSDTVRIVLRDKNENSRCYGSVHIQVNDTYSSVCTSQDWSQENAEVVCRELNCGTVIDKGEKPASEGIMDSVSCTGEESSLWHCRAKHYNRHLPCSFQPSVICSASIQVQLKDGPGRCAGRVEIFFEGEWKKVMIKKGQSWPENNARTVCRQLGCGGVQSRTEKFSVAERTNPMTRTVECTDRSPSISQCNMKTIYRSSVEDEEVGLVCENHRVFYLDSTSCSGRVRVQQGDRNYYLSGSNNTWNNESANEVCKQMHCGKADDLTKVEVDETSSIWHPDPSCSSTANPAHPANPLLDCGKNTSSSATNTAAWVKCSGTKTMNLTNKCWGNVNICVDSGCGGVCKKPWIDDDKSEKLCQDLECGSHVLVATKEKKDFPVKFKSVHIAEQGGNLSTSSLVENDGKCDSAYVVCSGSLKPRWKSEDYCSGKVEVEYENEWRSVCGAALQGANAQQLLCEKLDCGDALHSVDHKISIPNAISTMTCDNLTQHENLIECKASVAKSCTYHSLQCSKSRKMVLANGDACSGVVVVYFEGGKWAFVSSQGWSDKETEKLCKDLKCRSENRDNKPQHMFIKPMIETKFWKTTFNCTGVENDKNIWACETKVSPSKEEQVHIECPGEPEVKLEKGCHGKLTINNMPVCDTSWNNRYSDNICQQLNHSNALPGDFDNPQPVKGKKYFHIHCDEHHVKIGQCSRVMQACSGKLVSIYCTENVKFNLTEPCGGQIEVIHKTENGGKVCYDNLLPKYKNQICQQLNCGDSINKPKERKQQIPSEDFKQGVRVLSCTGEETAPQYCLSRESCSGKKTPAELYCANYKPPVRPLIEKKEVNVLAIILGVGLFLILVIVIFVFVRVYTIRKNKSVKNFLPGFAQGNDVEFDSGEFEEMHSKEMDDMKSGGIRSESEVVTENDARSTSSLPYDDIDEVSEVQPLTSRPSTTDDPRDSGIQNNKLEQNAKEDGVTYEVEDPEANYDDIEADVELAQTTAEVHDSPRNAPECSTNAPPDLVLGDDDYLVPGQDE